jgi:transposase
VTKRLETGAFTWPPVRDGAVTLTPLQLRLLFTGVDWTQLGVRAVAPAAEKNAPAPTAVGRNAEPLR